jgi:hypothetical protein
MAWRSSKPCRRQKRCDTNCEGFCHDDPSLFYVNEISDSWWRIDLGQTNVNEEARWIAANVANLPELLIRKD